MEGKEDLRGDLDCLFEEIRSFYLKWGKVISENPGDEGIKAAKEEFFKKLDDLGGFSNGQE